LGDAEHSSLTLTRAYPTSLLVFGGDLGHADHPPPATAVAPWLADLEKHVGTDTAVAIMTTQTRSLLLCRRLLCFPVTAADRRSSTGRLPSCITSNATAHRSGSPGRGRTAAVAGRRPDRPCPGRRSPPAAPPTSSSPAPSAPIPASPPTNAPTPRPHSSSCGTSSTCGSASAPSASPAKTM